jgi:hypothetical protein
MIDDILIHTGDPKTGTSSIQDMLQARAWRCARTALVPQPHLNNAPFANAVQPSASEAFRETQFGGLRDWFAQHKGGTGVISTEFLARRSPQRLRHLMESYFPGVPLRTLSYARPHASRAVSAFGQRLKTGTFNGSLPEFCRMIITTPTLHYARRFPEWKRVFGEGMILRPFVRSALQQNDVVADFLYHALRGEEFEILPLQSVNESLFVAELAGLSLLQSHFGSRGISAHHRLALGGALQRCLSALPDRKAEKPHLDQVSADVLLAAYLEDARTLDRMFFSSSIFEDALETAHAAALGAEEQDFRPETHFSASQREQIIAAAERICSCIKAMPKAWREAYQESTGQRPSLGQTDTRSRAVAYRRNRNIKIVWDALEEISQLLAAPKS